MKTLTQQHLSSSVCTAKLIFFYRFTARLATFSFPRLPQLSCSWALIVFDVGWRSLFRCGGSAEQHCHHPASLMLCPSTARCWSFVREPSVLKSGMNRGLIDESCLLGSVVSPLLYTEAGLIRWGRALTCCRGVGWTKKSCNILAWVLTKKGKFIVCWMYLSVST